MECEKKDIIIYRTHDGKASVALFAKDGKVYHYHISSLSELYGNPDVVLEQSN